MINRDAGEEIDSRFGRCDDKNYLTMPELQRITSRDNERLKFARRVRDGKEPRFILIEGPRLAEEALSSGIGIRSVFVTDDFISNKALGKLDTNLNARVAEAFAVSESNLGSISDAKTPQGITLIGYRPNDRDLAEVFDHSDPDLSILIFLSQVNNPSNLGAVIRTAEASGARGVITSNKSADPYSPKAIRASAGSVFRMPVVSDVETANCVEEARRAGMKIVAIDAKGTLRHTNVDWKTPTMLIFGSEAFGLSDELIEKVDSVVRIDMASPVESLNLAVSAGIVLFEARRQVLNA